MKYRGRGDIICNLLKTAKNGATKTRLTYAAFLSYAQSIDYLDFLKKRGLLRVDDTSRLYWTTEKGLHFVRVYNKISEMITEKATIAKMGGPEVFQPADTFSQQRANDKQLDFRTEALVI